MSKQEAAPGDVVCFNNEGDMAIISGPSYKSGIGVGSEWNAEAIVVVPSQNTVDGSLRCCALDRLAPEGVEPKTYDVCANFASEKTTESSYRRIPKFIAVHNNMISETSSFSLVGEGVAPSNAWLGGEGNITSIDGYTEYAASSIGDTEYDRFIPSPYDRNFNRFTYDVPVPDDNTGAVFNALDDIRGTTLSVNNDTKQYTPEDFVATDALGVIINYDSGYISQDREMYGWYIPSCFELLHFVALKDTISKNMQWNAASGKLLSYEAGFEDELEISGEIARVWCVDLEDGIFSPTPTTNGENSGWVYFYCLPFTKI